MDAKSVAFAVASLDALRRRLEFAMEVLEATAGSNPDRRWVQRQLVDIGNDARSAWLALQEPA